jgi:myo-inositol-1(or 4)-monophosphatase
LTEHKNSAYAEVAIQAAREAGALMVEWRKKFPPGPATMNYKSEKDVVTEVDTRAEEIIVNAIKKHFPDHQILAEERGAVGSNSDYLWIIDPLDGTANYAADLATSCVSIGLAYREEMLVGVVYDPFRNEVYTAERGQGAFLNGQPIKVGQQQLLSKAMVCFDLGYNEALAVKQLQVATFFRPRVRAMRILGSATLALCYVAVGRFDLFYHQSLHPWDLAAALLIINEAGGITTTNKGTPAHYSKPEIIAANPTIHAAFFEEYQHYISQ